MCARHTHGDLNVPQECLEGAAHFRRRAKQVSVIRQRHEKVAVALNAEAEECVEGGVVGVLAEDHVLLVGVNVQPSLSIEEELKALYIWDKLLDKLRVCVVGLGGERLTVVHLRHELKVGDEVHKESNVVHVPPQLRLAQRREHIKQLAPIISTIILAINEEIHRGHVCKHRAFLVNAVCRKPDVFPRQQALEPLLLFILEQELRLLYVLRPTAKRYEQHALAARVLNAEWRRRRGILALERDRHARVAQELHQYLKAGQRARFAQLKFKRLQWAVRGGEEGLLQLHQREV
ncbi:hypothetical protein DQ04_05941030 [Trypanosoma grayi]|uniref:hypothetical protein n=1 Tax=Trypanosoma grayi TaxID=71804 RepID=UPI0004F44301|nr:hypothetical protein DQ04_05941030 [Trypanosoma grayi]KEG09037.1 hypothetical protein DQ04_05941030 [Trypanosoma grayi]